MLYTSFALRTKSIQQLDTSIHGNVQAMTYVRVQFNRIIYKPWLTNYTLISYMSSRYICVRIQSISNININF